MIWLQGNPVQFYDIHCFCNVFNILSSIGYTRNQWEANDNVCIFRRNELQVPDNRVYWLAGMSEVLPGINNFQVVQKEIGKWQYIMQRFPVGPAAGFDCCVDIQFFTSLEDFQQKCPLHQGFSSRKSDSSARVSVEWNIPCNYFNQFIRANLPS